jgi:hypothetical protein
MERSRVSRVFVPGDEARDRHDRPEATQQRGRSLPMELQLSRKPVERDGDDYKRLKAAMARRLRGADE